MTVELSRRDLQRTQKSVGLISCVCGLREDLGQQHHAKVDETAGLQAAGEHCDDGTLTFSKRKPLAGSDGSASEWPISSRSRILPGFVSEESLPASQNDALSARHVVLLALARPATRPDPDAEALQLN